MANPILDYRFDRSDVTSSGGDFPLSFSGATVVAGPADSQLGRLAKAIDLGGGGRAQLDISRLRPDLRQFCVRVVVQANAAVTERQNVVESSRLPFALFLDKGTRDGEHIAVASVRADAHGWQAATTRYRQPMRPGSWYSIDLVYDIDTIGVFIDGRIVAVQAYPNGTASELGRNELFIGTWVDGARNHFNGKIAALQVWAGIPDALEQQLDEHRSHAEWFMSYKRAALSGRLELGAPTGDLAFDAAIGAYIQHHERGAISYADATGVAFEMHGGIYAFYKTYQARSELGYPVTDEGGTARAGGRKTLFSKGGIYWSAATGAVPVVGQIYLDYENLGESGTLGFPTRPQSSVPNGLEQQFDQGRMYYRTGDSHAHEVNGGILTKYLAIGGVQQWGFPVTNESDVKANGGVIGRLSEFEACTIYWSARTGAFEVHGDIRRHYVDIGGPAGELGLPTSDERDIPGVSGPGRYTTFENGSLLWYGSRSSIITARPFKIYIQRISTKEEEGLFQGQNDIYFKLTIKEGPNTVYDRRHPSSGDYGGHNDIDVRVTVPNRFVPNDPGKTITMRIDVWDADSAFGGDDDHLGTYDVVLDMANGWGLRENQGVHNSGTFSSIRSILWSVKPEVEVSLLSETQKFWGASNRGTPHVSYQQYAEAFRDVDSDAEWWDLTDWLEKAFYELVVDTLAASGNCFGMSLEAIYARKGISVFSLPIDRFTAWDTVRPEFNIKHCYQAGAAPIWWFVDQFLGGNTHDPKDVFARSRAAFERGQHPVLCLSQNYDFSGAPHCILPVRWDASGRPWRIDICDPNAPGVLRQLTVNPDNNTFEYLGSSTYRGGEWSGGRLHYMPFAILDSQPRTPIWDAILLLLNATVVILGDDAETATISDRNGNDLNAYGERGRQLLQRGATIDEFFVGYRGFDGEGTVKGELLMQKRPVSAVPQRPGLRADPTLVAHQPIAELARDPAAAALADTLRAQPALGLAIGNRTVAHVLADRDLAATLNPELIGILTSVAQSNRATSYHHKVRGRRNGNLRYGLKTGLSELQLQASITNGEETDLQVHDMRTSQWTVAAKPGRDKQLTLRYVSKLGVGRDHVTLSFENLPMTGQRGMEINLRPGLGGLDVVTGAGRVDLPVTLSARIDGRAIDHRFVVPVDGGLRLKPASVLSQSLLSISRIDRLFGPALTTSVVQPR